MTQRNLGTPSRRTERPRDRTILTIEVVDWEGPIIEISAAARTAERSNIHTDREASLRALGDRIRADRLSEQQQ
jgi:hypothetical protein